MEIIKFGTLRARVYTPKEPKAVVNIVHGLGSHSGRMEHVSNHLVKNGYAVFAMDRYGHGLSSGKRGHADSFEDIMDNIETSFDQIEKRFKGLDVFLYGHSLGGNLVLNYPHYRDADIKGLIATSPWIELVNPPGGLQLFLAKAVRPIYPKFTVKEWLDPTQLSRDKKTLKRYKKDKLVHREVTVALTLDCLESGLGLFDKEKLDIPVLLMHGSADKITSHSATERYSKRVSDDATFKSWKGYYHETHNDIGWKKVVSFVLNWLEKY